MLRRLFFPGLAMLALLADVLVASAQSLTVEVGSPPPLPTQVTLVDRGDIWRWHRGTNQPQADWRTTNDASLNPAAWNSGPGGFGYGDPGIVGEGTTVNPGMSSTHTTLYIRREFNVPADLDTNVPLSLTVDFDDGFVAYLNGQEIARANVAGAVGSAVSNTAGTPVNHEASCCESPMNPATNIVLGTVGSRLVGPGPHVLAVIGVNGNRTSSDFHIIVSLGATTGQATAPPVVNYGLYALSTTNRVTLTGTNTLAGSTRVTVNGEDAAFNPGTGAWSLDRTLPPGMSRFYVAAHDATGQILSNRVQDVVYQTSEITAGGALAANTAWTDPGAVVHVTSNLSIPSGVSLDVGPGVVLIVSPGVNLVAGAGGTMTLSGSDAAPVWVRGVGMNNFGEIAADGEGSALTIRFADITRGAVKFRDGALGVYEDSFHYQYKNGSVPIAGSTRAALVTVRRCHFRYYHETLWQYGLIHVEDSLFEDADNASSDALDYDGALPGSHIRRCTFRNGPNTNTDATDIGSGCTNTIVADCIMHHFPNDKGVSIGEASFGIVVSNCVMWRNDSGVAVKDSCTANILGNTIVDCDFGFRLYNKANPASPTGGGHITNSANNIVWGNRANFEILNAATVVADYSDLQDTNFPGVGNLSVDPLFVDPAARDYRLQAGSPCRGAGTDGVDLGVLYPVGGIGVAPAALAVVQPGTNSLTLVWRDLTDNEDGTIIERSAAEGVWQVIGVAGPNVTQFIDTAVAGGAVYSYRARTTNGSGISPASNVARGTTASTTLFAGGVISVNTTWSGRVVVTNTVIVTNGAVLSALPGTIIQLGSNLNITGAGSTINFTGTAAEPIRLERTGTNFTRWGEVAATGAAGSVTLRHVVLMNGRVRVTSGATLTAEDSDFSLLSGTSILSSSSAGGVTLRRIHVHDYQSIDFVSTRVLAEDSLFERLALPSSDAFEMQGSPAGSIVRRCTFRDATGANTDALDMNGCTGVLIEDCMIYNITDKGISSGSATQASDPTSRGLVVRNTLVWGTDTGISIKDDGTAAIFGSVFTGCRTGIEVKNKFTANGGHVTNGANNIIWGNTASPFTITGAGASIVMDYSDVEGTNQPGTGNLSVDPQWRNPLARDYRLAAGSPCAGTGDGGADMGITYPTGGRPGTPATPTATVQAGPTVDLAWEAVVRASSYVIARSVNGGPFVPHAEVAAPATGYVDTNVVDGSAYAWQVTARNFIGDSFASAPASVSLVQDADGDGMPDAWEIAHGLNPAVDDSQLDADNDGMKNRDEYLAGTDPQSASSRLALVATGDGPGRVVLALEALEGRSYSILTRPNLGAGVWSVYLQIPAAPGNRLVVVTNAAPGLQQFFRVVTPAQP